MNYSLLFSAIPHLRFNNKRPLLPLIFIKKKKVLKTLPSDVFKSSLFLFNLLLFKP